MKLTAYACSHKGGRVKNEDAVAYHVGEDFGVFVAADGLGGHPGGDIASRTVADALLSELTALERQPFSAGVLDGAFGRVNQLLMQQQQNPGPCAMMTTAVALVIAQGTAMWGHVGDSRLYHISGGNVTVTRDHSVSYKKYLSGEITLNQINSDEDRCSLLGAMGSRSRSRPEILPAPRALLAGDAFLLCTDGLWETLSLEEITGDLARSETPEEWAGLLLARHDGRAEPDCDNFSLITVFAEDAE